MVTYSFHLYSRSSHNFIPFTGLMNSINWPASSVWVFIAQLGEHCSANAEATGSNPVEAPKNFFSGYFRNCLNCDSLRWSHTHFISTTVFDVLNFQTCNTVFGVVNFQTSITVFNILYFQLYTRTKPFSIDSKTSALQIKSTIQNSNFVTENWPSVKIKRYFISHFLRDLIQDNSTYKHTIENFALYQKILYRAFK